MSSSDQNPPANRPSLCANSCGFYGNPLTKNLCSQCYRSSLIREQQQVTHLRQQQAVAAIASPASAPPPPATLTRSGDNSAGRTTPPPLSPVVATAVPDVAMSSPSQSKRKLSTSSSPGDSSSPPLTSDVFMSPIQDAGQLPTEGHMASSVPGGAQCNVGPAASPLISSSPPFSDCVDGSPLKPSSPPFSDCVDTSTMMVVESASGGNFTMELPEKVPSIPPVSAADASTLPGLCEVSNQEPVADACESGNAETATISGSPAEQSSQSVPKSSGTTVERPKALPTAAFNALETTDAQVAQSTAAAASPVAPSPEEEAPARATQANIRRCWKCAKKIGLLGFQCRCGYFFCGSHRYADAHTCDFDYKHFERANLSKANQKVIAEKLNKI